MDYSIIELSLQFLLGIFILMHLDLRYVYMYNEQKS